MSEPGQAMLFPAGFDAGDFLRHHWQKQPLLLRGSGHFRNPLSPEELAGLACENFIESRLVFWDRALRDWKVEHGPFPEERFPRLPEQDYSLLVQAVDQWHAGVRALLHAFDFLPAWRLDDIMVSYSTDGGNVGPHFDHYDVFLIQGRGHKRWRIGQECDSTTPLRQDSDMRLLSEFQPTDEYLVEPGDILYIPAGLAHHGVAQGPSMTYSVGFRAPSHGDVLAGLGEFLAQSCREDQRYRDKLETVPADPGEVPREIAGLLRDIVTEKLHKADPLLQWFGQHMSSPRDPEAVGEADPVPSLEAFRHQLEAQGRLDKNPASRFAFSQGKRDIMLFADGCTFSCSPAMRGLVSTLCRRDNESLTVSTTMLEDREILQLLQSLYNQGSLLEDIDDD